MTTIDEPVTLELAAYHGDPAVKARYLARVEAHRRADEIVQGRYWYGGRGCAVGCTIHGSDHARYEPELGIPVAIAQLEDAIFEGLPVAEAREWPRRFLAAIAPGADLSCVVHHFLAWLLADEWPRHFDAAEWPAVAEAVRSAAALHGRAAAGEEITDEEWSAARSAAPAASAAAAAEWSASAAMEWSASAATEWSAAATYRRMAEKLIELLSLAPIVAS